MPELISVVTPCYHEEENVEHVYRLVKEVFAKLSQYRYEHIFIDNASKDKTVPILKSLAAKDRNLKIIVNTRNFGQIRSPYHALLQATGDAVIFLMADLQDPPELISVFIKEWEKGFKVVIGEKIASEESFVMKAIRKFYYTLTAHISDVELYKNCTGFGLFDRDVVEAFRKIEDPYPYFRGLLAEFGFAATKIPYKQPQRKHGKTKNNFYTLYDTALLGITSHSKLPLRLVTMTGFIMSSICLFIAFAYFIAKLLLWQYFTLGLAPIAIGLFFLGSVQLLFIGIIGEYLGFVYTQVLKRPLVIEKERINFDPVDVLSSKKESTCSVQ